MKNSLFICFFLCHLLLAGCDKGEGICTTDVVSRVHAGFYVRDSLGERDTLLKNFGFYGILRPDSLIYDGVGVKKIVFPLPDVNQQPTLFAFAADTLWDTLKIFHDPMLFLVSFECGFTTHHTIHWVSHKNTIIDTIVISDPLVDLENYENLKIYIRPSSDPGM